MQQLVSVCTVVISKRAYKLRNICSILMYFKIESDFGNTRSSSSKVNVEQSRFHVPYRNQFRFILKCNDCCIASIDEQKRVFSLHVVKDDLGRQPMTFWV